MRISKQRLQDMVDRINEYGEHHVRLYFTGGCGVYTTIDGKEYERECRDGSYMGISNRKVYELIVDMYDEALNGLIKRNLDAIANIRSQYE